MYPMDVQFTNVEYIGNDRLAIYGLIDGHKVTAFGWLSAITNHFDDDHYQHALPTKFDDHGRPLDGELGAPGMPPCHCNPRTRSEKEILDYFDSRLLDLAGQTGAATDAQTLAQLPSSPAVQHPPTVVEPVRVAPPRDWTDEYARYLGEKSLSTATRIEARLQEFIAAQEAKAALPKPPSRWTRVKDFLFG